MWTALSDWEWPPSTEATTRKCLEFTSSKKNAAFVTPAASLKRQMWRNSSSNSHEMLWDYRPSCVT